MPKAPQKEDICVRTARAGAIRTGFAAAGPPAEADADAMSLWIREGCQAGMQWLERHAALRRDPANVLPGAKTVISAAFAYSASGRDPSLPQIAAYAQADDYHEVLRARLAPVAEYLRALGFSARICIDSAPLPERYWAARAGVGERGLNGAVLLPETGPYCLLAEILTDAEIEPDEPARGICTRCGACVRACPTGALRPDGTVDARRCLSYLTIEKRGEWAPEERRTVESAPPTLFGCDICLRACPLTPGRPAAPSVFTPRPEVTGLTAEQVLNMTQQEFSRLFRGSPIKRAKLDGLQRNASAALRSDS